MSARWSVQWECGVQDLCLFQMCIFMLGKSHSKKIIPFDRGIDCKIILGSYLKPSHFDLFFTSTPAETIKIGHWIVFPVHKGSGGNPNSYKTEEQSIRQVFFLSWECQSVLSNVSFPTQNQWIEQLLKTSSWINEPCEQARLPAQVQHSMRVAQSYCR